MDRRKFIRNTSLAGSVLWLSPALAGDIGLRTSLSIRRLKINEHIRHGLYQADPTLNSLDGLESALVKIDRFLNPEGDMMLFDFVQSKEPFRIAVVGNKLWISEGEITREFETDHDLQISTRQGEVILKKNSTHLNLSSSAIFLQGNLVCNGERTTSPALISGAGELEVSEAILFIPKVRSNDSNKTTA